MKTLALVLALAFTTAAFPQVTQDDPHKVAPVMNLLAEIDIANQILPIVLTKDQIRRLLPAIERCRKHIRDQEKKEADRLKELMPEIERVHSAAVRGAVPSPEFLDKIDKLFATFENERRGVLIANGLILMEAVNEVFHEGQKRAAIGVVNRVYDPEANQWTDATDDAKLRFFALNVFLGDKGYDFLVRLSTAN